MVCTPPPGCFAVQTVQTAGLTMCIGSLFIVPFLSWVAVFHVCVWDSIFRANCIFRLDPDYNSTCWGGHGRWEDGAAGDVGHTKMGLLGVPSGVHSSTGVHR